jgi:hypothetical protein
VNVNTCSPSRFVHAIKQRLSFGLASFSSLISATLTGGRGFFLAARGLSDGGQVVLTNATGLSAKALDPASRPLFPAGSPN